MLRNLRLSFFWLTILSTSTFAQFPIVSSGDYTGGSGDNTNVTNPHLKLQGVTGYARVVHLSPASTPVSTVYNYQGGKDVYWGEDTDGGKYLFRGRDVNMSRGLTVYGTVGIGINNLPSTPTTGIFEVRGGAILGSTTGSNRLLTCTSIGAVGSATNYYQNNIWIRRDSPGSDWLTARLHNGISIDGSFLTPGTDTKTWWERSPFKDIQAWGNGSATYMSLEQGKLNMGATSNTSYKLAVAGKIAATGEVRVFTDGTTAFPDYVFDPSYQLPSLEETEKYVKENHHLPEVPSAADIEKDGMSLNGMNTILLKKVEELTLYMIEMKKENEIMKKEIKVLKENQKR
jgi:hypothetical protein